MSLATCIKKAGKALSKEDATAIREIRDELTSGGMSAAEANPKAIDEYLGTLTDERAEIMDRVGKAGGITAAVSSSKFASGDLFNQDVTKEQALADEIAKRDAKRNTGQESTETGQVDDLFSEANKQNELRFSIDNDFAEKVADKDPQHPLAQTVKFGAAINQVTEQAEESVGTLKGLRDKKNDMSRRGFLAMLPQSKLIDVVRDEIQGIIQYIKTKNAMDGFISEHLERLADIGGRWRRLIRKDHKQAQRLGRVMHFSTIARADPSKVFKMPKTFDKMNQEKRLEWIKRKRDHAILQKEWNKLSPEAQAIYQETREEYKKLRVDTLDGLADRIEATEADKMITAKLIATLRAEFESAEIDPYFPLARFGQHWGTAFDRTTGKVVAFMKFEKSSVRDEWLKGMRKEGFKTLKSEETKSNMDNVNRIDPTFVAKVTELTKGMTSKDKDSKETISIPDEIWQLYLRSLPDVSARTANIHRQGRLGFSGDALRAFGHHMFHGIHQLGKLNYGFQMQNFLDNIDQEAKELTARGNEISEELETKSKEEVHAILLDRYPRYKKLFTRLKKENSEKISINKAIKEFIRLSEVDGAWARPLANEMKARHEYNMNPQSASWATKATGAGFFWFLSTSPMAGIVNLTQTAIVAGPILMARFKKGSAAGELLRASGQLTKSRGDFVNTLRGNEKKAFEVFDKQGMYAKTRVRDMTGYAEQGENFADKKQVAIDVASWIFHHTEKWNREVTSIAAYRLAIKNGRTHEQAVEETFELVEMSHFDYTNTNRPRIMQNDYARVALLFRNYSLNMTYRLARDFKDGVLQNKNVEPEIRTEALKRFTGIIGMTGLFAGTSGLPAIWLAHFILDNVMGDDDEPFDSQAAWRAYLTDQYGESVATFITHGAIDELTDATISTRVSLNNLWIRDVPESKKGADLIGYLAVELLGPLAGAVADASQGVKLINENEPYRGFEKMLPKFLKDAMKTYRFATEGATTLDRDVMITAEEFQYWPAFLQFIGATPSQLTTVYEQNRVKKDMQMSITGRKNYLMSRLSLALRAQDEKQVKHINKLILRYNAKNPRNIIDAKGIQQSMKTRLRNDMHAIDGLTLPPRYEYLHEKFDFTDDEDTQ